MRRKVLLQERDFLKKNKKTAFWQILIVCSFLLTFLGITIFLFTYRRDEHRFHNAITRFFREEMSGNTLNMHYTLANPVDFGVYDYDVVLPRYSSQNQLMSQAKTENLLALLRSIDPSKLNETDKYTRNLLLQSLDNTLAMSEYTYYQEPLSPSSGMQSQLPILLAEYTFRSKQDVEDYLELLDQTDEYFDSLLLFEQEKAEAGLLMPSSSLRKVMDQCASILTKEELASGNHFLQTTFLERLQELYAAGGITQEEAKYYLGQNNRLLSTVMLPAYEALYDGLFILEDESIPLEGLAAKPEGASYYEYLLVSETGSYRSVADIKKMLLQQFEAEYQAIREMILASPDLAASFSTDALDAAFPYQDPARMLTDLQQRMKDDFPAFDSSQTLPSVTVKAVSESFQDYCAPAFYLTPPLDDTITNVIYINERNSPSGLELYTTLAHEGYPGHMYQTVYSNRDMLAEEDSYIRQILWYGGYQEGWALYVEFLSYDYASELMKEQGKEDLTTYIQLEKHNRSLQLCLYSLLDIMIHYENAPYDQIQKVLGAFGITNEASVYSIYTYLVEEPANYLKYYLGYMEILALQQEALTLWGENYSDYTFHTFFLECGPSDFTTIREYLRNTDVPGNSTPTQEPLFVISRQFLVPARQYRGLVWQGRGRNRSDYAMLFPG